MGEERRKSIRIKKLINVRYSYSAGNGDKKWDMTTVKDISETGMCITTHQLFSPDDIMPFLIKIPSRPLDWMEFTGRVVKSERLTANQGESAAILHVTRVEFINLKEDQKESIKQYIEWFLNKEGGGQK